MSIRANFFVIILSLTCSITNTWAGDLIGKWKTIDDKSGFAKAIVGIYKNSDGSYAGKIEKIYNLPDNNENLGDLCIHCRGDLKDKPYLGMRVLYNFTQSSQNEYINGKVLDPATGDIYKAKIKMNSSGKRITLRGYIGVSLLGRSQTWIRVE